jgi:hypothetical protein
MPLYRLVFPPLPGSSFETAPTAEIDSGDVIYAVGDIIVHEGTRWQVSQAPLEGPPILGDPLEVMVWPASDDDGD